MAIGILKRDSESVTRDSLLTFSQICLGVSKGGFLRLAWLRAPVAIINFAFLVRGFLIESYINSEIFTGDLTRN